MALTDPTLSSCCARDLKEQRQAATLRSALAAVDRSAAAQRERGRAVALSGEAAWAAAAARARGEQEDDDDDDDDNELARLREARLADMRRQAAARRVDGAAGFGRLNDAKPPEEALRQAAASGASHCVLHLAADGHDAGAQLDERLDELARGLGPAGGGGGEGEQQQRGRRRQLGGGVLFVRASVGAAAAPSAAVVALCRRLGLGPVAAGALPALVVLGEADEDDEQEEDGGSAAPPPPPVLACAQVARFCADGALLDDRVDAFLRAAGVPLSKTGGNGVGAGSGGSEDDKDEEDGGAASREAPCELCGRTYPHEHVRAVHGRREEESDGDSDG